jgi:hypothetical protein
MGVGTAKDHDPDAQKFFAPLFQKKRLFFLT